jgi:hypothetical protein
MARRIATIRGTAMAPGVSLNGRLYSKELIGKAVKRAQERLAGGEPLTMLTHHGAEDDSTRIVGRVTSLTQAADGSAKFVADLADTAHGRDLAALTTGDQPYLDGVSIRGWWLGDVRQEQHRGQTVETGDDLELDGLDFTKTPGVLAARLDRDRADATESTGGRVLVYESVAATVEPSRTPYGDVAYADLGYRPDRVRRLPLDTTEHAVRAWRRLESGEAAAYTSAQLKRIRARVKDALKDFGVDVSEHTTRYGEITEYYPEMGGAAGFCIDAYNGPISLTLRACGVEPADLQAVAAAAMAAACSALAAMDPDMDADIDADMGETVTVKVSGSVLSEAELHAAVRRDALQFSARDSTDTAPAAPAGDTTTTTQEVPAVSEAQSTAAETAAPTTEAPPAMVAFTQEQFAALLDRIAAPAPIAEAAPVAPVVEETADQRVQRLVAEQVEGIKDALRGELRAVGPRRLGLVTPTKESQAAPEKPLHEMSEEERNAYATRALNGGFGFEV